MRLIDADKLIKKFQSDKEYFDKVGDTTFAMATIGVINDIEDAPTIDVPTWIPCSERLPKEENCPMDCLVTRKSKYIGNYTDMAVCEKNGTWTHEDWDAIVLEDVEDGKSTGLISTRDDNIIAWMPLPKPYEERKETDHE